MWCPSNFEAHKPFAPPLLSVGQPLGKTLMATCSLLERQTPRSPLLDQVADPDAETDRRMRSNHCRLQGFEAGTSPSDRGMSVELRRLRLAQESPGGLPTVLRYLYSTFLLITVSSSSPRVLPDREGAEITAPGYRVRMRESGLPSEMYQLIVCLFQFRYPSSPSALDFLSSLWLDPFFFSLCCVDPGPGLGLWFV